LKKQLDVVGAVILKDGEVLCAQRGPDSRLPGLWEFPGGKVDPGETPRQALEREIIEELRCRVEVGEQVERTTYEYDFAVVTLTTFYCSLKEGTPELTEHAAVAWLPPSKLETLDWAPADIPAVKSIRRGLP
jgi:8-oxo-dGTP diphosphatase